MRAGHRSCVYYRFSFVSRTQGYQALYVFLELSLPLFNVVKMLAHSISKLVPVGLAVSAAVGGEACGCESPLEMFDTSQAPRPHRDVKLSANIKCLLQTTWTAKWVQYRQFVPWGTRWQLEGSGFDSRWCHWNFSLT